MGFLDLFKPKKVCQKSEDLKETGVITHYFPHVKAAVIKVTRGPLRVGDEIYVKGHTTDFRQAVKSMQINRSPIKEAKKGHEVGVKVKSRVRVGDVIYVTQKR